MGWWGVVVVLSVVATSCAVPTSLAGASSTGTTPAAGATQQPATTSCTSSWTVTPESSTTGAYNAVSAVSGSDVWSVGYKVQARGTTPSAVAPLATRWNGTKSLIEPTPAINSQHAELNDVSMGSAADGWAVGFARTPGKTAETYGTLAEHWNGTAWTIVPTPNAVAGGVNELESVAELSSTDVWAVGFGSPIAEAPRTPMALLWNGTSWVSEPVPAVGPYGTVLLGVSGTAADDVWAVGYAWTSIYQDEPILEHWNGTSWSVVTGAATGTPAVLTAVSTSGAADAWAVGYTDGFRPYAEHWNGTTWSAATIPPAATVQLMRGVVDESPTDAWAVGTAYVVGTSDQYEGVYSHWNGTTWSTALLPVPGRSTTRIAKGLQMRGISMAAGTPQLWAAGGIPGQQLLNLCSPEATSGRATGGIGSSAGAPAPTGASGAPAPTGASGAPAPTGASGATLPALGAGTGRAAGAPPAMATASVPNPDGSNVGLAASPEPVYAVDEAGPSGIGQTTTGWTATVNDFNGNGDTSVFLMRGAKAASLYLNDGNGTFTQVDQGEFPPADRWDCVSDPVQMGALPAVYCAIGADHANGLKASQLYVRNSNGTYTNEASTYGLLDPTGRGRIGAFLAMGAGHLPALFVGQDPFRGDGLPHTNHLYVNSGTGSFADDPQAGLDLPYGSTCAVPGDYLGTGYDDLLLCTPTDGEHLYENNGGTFTDVTAQAGLPNVQAVGAAWGHFTTGKRLDLALLTSTKLMVFLQRRNNTFRLSFSMPVTDGTSLAAGDVNNGGVDDLYVVTGGSRKMNRPDLMLINNGSGTAFQPLSIPQAASGTGDAAYPLDYGGNGLTDFLVLNGIGEHVPGPLQLLTFFPDGKPQPPTVGNAAAGVAQATVSFTPPTEYGGSTISKYTVTATDATNATNGGQTASAGSSPITVTGLTPGDTYTFSVTATNSSGTSAPSAQSNPVVPT